MDERVPSMIFQPLLENAFNHGFIDGEILHIIIKGYKSGEEVVFEIANDGSPMSDELLDRIKKGDFNSLKKSSSLGISNTIERLQLFYRKNVKISFLNEDHQVKVVIQIIKGNP